MFKFEIKPPNPDDLMKAVKEAANKAILSKVSNITCKEHGTKVVKNGENISYVQCCEAFSKAVKDALG